MDGVYNQFRDDVTHKGHKIDWWVRVCVCYCLPATALSLTWQTAAGATLLSCS